MDVLQLLKKSIEIVQSWDKEFIEIGLNQEQKSKISDMMIKNGATYKFFENKELENRIYKAIEYIENNLNYIDNAEDQEQLLKILKGE